MNTTVAPSKVANGESRSGDNANSTNNNLTNVIDEESRPAPFDPGHDLPRRFSGRGGSFERGGYTGP